MGTSVPRKNYSFSPLVSSRPKDTAAFACASGPASTPLSRHRQMRTTNESQTQNRTRTVPFRFTKAMPDHGPTYKHARKVRQPHSEAFKERAVNTSETAPNRYMCISANGLPPLPVLAHSFGSLTLQNAVNADVSASDFGKDLCLRLCAYELSSFCQPNLQLL